jgi:hypothetical protein
MNKLLLQVFGASGWVVGIVGALGIAQGLWEGDWDLAKMTVRILFASSGIAVGKLCGRLLRNI